MAEHHVPHTYSAEFHEAIEVFHDGRESLSGHSEYLATHLGGEKSRFASIIRQVLPELRHYVGELEGLDVLDFGCGTGATSAALRLAGAQVVAFDVDEPSARTCRARLVEHEITDVTVHCAPWIDETDIGDRQFDVVFMNAVIEHVPLSVPGIRARVLADAFARVKPGGVLFINQTPNRLWPRDIYATGLWWLPWTKPGNLRSYRKAVAKGRHLAGETPEAGSLALEVRGAWGVRYGEVMAALPADARCANLEPGSNRWSSNTIEVSGKRRVVETIAFHTLTRFAKRPVAVVSPMYSPLVVRRSPH